MDSLHSAHIILYIHQIVHTPDVIIRYCVKKNNFSLFLIFTRLSCQQSLIIQPAVMLLIDISLV